jgi:cytochrome P450
MWWVLVVAIVSYLAILAIKEIKAYRRCRFYEAQGFRMKYVPFFGHRSMFDVDPVKDKDDQLGTWKRCFEPFIDGPGLVINDWEESKAFIWLTDLKLVKEFFVKELSCVSVFKRYRERIQFDFFYSNDSRSLEIRNAFSEYFFKENLNSKLPWMIKTWKSRLSEALKANQVQGNEGYLDMGKVSHRYILDICNLLVFGEEHGAAPRLKDTGEEVIVAIGEYQRRLLEESGSFLNYVLFKLPSQFDLTKGFRELTKEATRLQTAIMEVYNERSRLPDERLGLNIMDMIVKKNRQTEGAAFSGMQIVAAIATHVLAPVSSTTSALGQAFLEYGKRPEIAERIRKEVHGLHLLDSDVTVDNLDQAVVLSAFMKESLRVYPPAAFSFEKKVHKDFTLGQYKFRKGDLIDIPYFILQRAVGESSEKIDFDIDRFLDPERAKSQPYLPFSFGYRSCTGKPLAEQAMKVAFAVASTMSDITADLEKYPAVRMQGESYQIDQCIIKGQFRPEYLG